MAPSRDKVGSGGYKERPASPGTLLEQFMRIVCVAGMAASLFVTLSAPVTGAHAQTLRPGHPAGVHAAAQRGSPNTFLMIGIGAVILGGVGILASGDSSAVATLQISSQPIIAPPTVTTVVSTSTASTP
jgi:hypothetical protein